MSERVWVFDTTLRDGEQSPGCSMTLDEKLRMARQLDRLGVDIMEAGFPIASQGDFKAVRAIAAEYRRPVIAALARANRLDIDRAWEALKDAARPRIHVFIATSDIHLKYKLRKTREGGSETDHDDGVPCQLDVLGCGIFARGCGPNRPKVSDRMLPRSRGGRSHRPEPSRYGGLLSASRVWTDVCRC